MKPKLIRITTVPISLEKLLENQLIYMSKFFDIIAISSNKQRLENYGLNNKIQTYHLNLTRKITPLNDIFCLLKLIFFLKKNKPKIVHTHTPKAGIIGMLAAYLAGVPVRLHTVAGLPLMESKRIKKIILIVVEKLTYFFQQNYIQILLV